MTARYLDIQVLQEPFDMPPDENGRACVVFNIDSVKTQSETFLEELVQILVDADVAYEKQIYCSSAVTLPKTGSFLSIIETGGPGPQRTHNEALPAYARPSAKITARAGTYKQARTLAKAAYDALAVIRNQDVTTS